MPDVAPRGLLGLPGRAVGGPVPERVPRSLLQSLLRLLGADPVRETTNIDSIVHCVTQHPQVLPRHPRVGQSLFDGSFKP